jgi:predicted phosphodiesterase
MFKGILCFCTILSIVSCGVIPNSPSTNVSAVESIDGEPDFSFIAFSDNHGYSVEHVSFAWMEQYRETTGVSFAIGVGDHVKRLRAKPFLDLLRENSWWSNHFYPNIADGENAYFSGDQSIWGSGGGLLEYVNFSQADSLFVRENLVEYYARVSISPYTIHIIQVHFPDFPQNVNYTFRCDSKEFIVNTLNQIEKASYDIVIVAAHSLSGVWHHLLSEAQQQLLFDRADFIFSASTHIHEILKQNDVYIINTGSITDPFLFAPPGFIEVKVFSDPVRFSVSFVDVSNKVFELD